MPGQVNAGGTNSKVVAQFYSTSVGSVVSTSTKTSGKFGCCGYHNMSDCKGTEGHFDLPGSKGREGPEHEYMWGLWGAPYGDPLSQGKRASFPGCLRGHDAVAHTPTGTRPLRKLFNSKLAW